MSDKTLVRLQELLSKEMVRVLEEGVVTQDNDGNIVRLTPGAPMLSVIRQYLKDNNMQLTDPEKDEEARTMRRKLPEFNDDDELAGHLHS